jgi:ubiquinol-cytochrome c reductase cytochrome c subunit
VSGRATCAALACALLAALAGAPRAGATPPPPIVKPSGENRMSPLQLGAQLFAGNCVSCHGIGGSGVLALTDGRGANEIARAGPPLIGVGALAADFYTRTGYMPLGSPLDQPIRSRVQFSRRERQALVQYVASLGGGPPVPRPDVAAGDVAEGRELFTEHCSGCHQVVAAGGVMPGAKAPPLNDATPVEVAEAVRIGPYVMPKFTKKDISDAQLNSIVAYVQYAKNPDDAGGWGLDHLGPFPEGMVTWLIAAVVLVLTCMLIGKRMSQT